MSDIISAHADGRLEKKKINVQLSRITSNKAIKYDLHISSYIHASFESISIPNNVVELSSDLLSLTSFKGLVLPNNLKTLSFSGKLGRNLKIANFDGLVLNDKLKKLSTQLIHFDSFSGLTLNNALSELSIDHSLIPSFKGLILKEGLKKLNCSGTRIKNFDFLKLPVSLSEFEMRHSLVSSLKGLVLGPNMTHLDIRYTDNLKQYDGLIINSVVNIHSDFDEVNIESMKGLSRTHLIFFFLSLEMKYHDYNSILKMIL